MSSSGSEEDCRESIPSHVEAPANVERSTPRNPLLCVHKSWVSFTAGVRTAIARIVTGIAVSAASWPILCIFVLLAVTVGTVGAGLKTNFVLDLDIMEMFTPTTSLTGAHRQWVFWDSGFIFLNPLNYHQVQIILHKNGGNVLEVEGVKHLYQALDVATSLDGYQKMCLDSSSAKKDSRDCDIQSLTRFWNHSESLFQTQVSTDSDIVPFLSMDTFPDNATVDLNKLVGVYQVDNGRGGTHTAQALFLEINLPVGRIGSRNRLDAYRDAVSTSMAELRQQWSREKGNDYQVEYPPNTVLKEEFETAVFVDFPLLPFILLIMILFTVTVFWKCHLVESRFLLALGAVLTVFLSLATGFGFMFILGLPYGVINNILPFVIVGVGLDDTYIIHGAFSRTDRQSSPVERVRDTFNEIGLSIFMTTATTSLAFGLGCISTIPAIQNLCVYAFPTLIIDFLYQITFFVAVLVLDERRIQGNRFDCCCCFISRKPQPSAAIQSSASQDEEQGAPTEDARRQGEEQQDSAIYRIGQRGMSYYADQLLRPWVRPVVLLVFAGFTAICIYNALHLEQSFSFLDLLPDYSPSKTYYAARQNYGGITNDNFYVYFRNLNQSDPAIQDQMIDYLDEISALDHIVEEPFCWVRDVRQLQQDSKAFVEDKMQDPPSATILQDNPYIVWFLQNQTTLFQSMSTREIVNILVEDKLLRLIYRPQVVQNEEGDVIHSRCELNIKDLDYRSIPDQLEVNRAYHAVTNKHPLNQDRDYDYLHAFLYEDMLHLWDFFQVALVELKYTAFSGIAVVTFFGFLFVPHWSAIFYIFPLMCILYADLLGLLHMTGLSINILTYVVLVVSVGLLVDFIMHMLLRFFELKEGTKEQRIKATLQSMGTAILLGGVSTFLGTIPLFFSQSYVFRTVCVSFFSMVLLGMTHGLILLPVLLSLFGGCGTTGVQSSTNSTASKSVQTASQDSFSKSNDECDSDNHQDLHSPMSSASTALESVESGEGTSPLDNASVKFIERGKAANTFDQYEIRLSKSLQTFDSWETRIEGTKAYC